MTFYSIVLLGLFLIIIIINNFLSLYFIQVLPWSGFGEHAFAHAFSNLVLIDYVGDRFNCILKFGFDFNDELSCKVTGGWTELCKAHDVTEGNKVKFCITQSIHNYIMYVYVYPRLGVETTLKRVMVHSFLIIDSCPCYVVLLASFGALHVFLSI
jgi:hypothetical protein